MKNPHIARALLLLGQSRYELAEEALRQALAADPDDAQAHALLAISLAHREKYDAAEQEAQQAVHLAPDHPYPHYALAAVLRERRRLREAEDAIAQSIALNPHDADYFSLEGWIRFEQRRWREALESAERGLEVDPEHVECTNLKAVAMVRLRQPELAKGAIETALQRNPEEAFTHANLGWTLLESGEREKAMEHFREALRLEPNLEYAREGIIEAMKSRFFIYRIFLAYLLWMKKFSRRGQWAVLIGGYIGYRIVLNVAEQHPAAKPWLVPLIVAYVAFALLTWLAYPLFNLLLRLSRLGRLALSRTEAIVANLSGICLLLGAVCLGIYLGTDHGLIAAVTFALLIPAITAVSHCERGWPRGAMIGVTSAVLVVGLVGGVAEMIFPLLSDTGKMLVAVPGYLSLQAAPFVFLGAIIAVNALPMMRPKR